MNRLIKFRAWHKKEKKMYLVDSIDFANEFIEPKTDIPIVDFGFDEVELLQYTGLKDKKRTEEFPEGQEIYEGDIIKKHAREYPEYYPDEFLIVRYEEHAPQVCYVLYKDINEKDFIRYDFVRLGSLFNDDDIYDLEVVGNIYENPELLNEKEAA